MHLNCQIPNHTIQGELQYQRQLHQWRLRRGRSCPFSCSQIMLSISWMLSNNCFTSIAIALLSPFFSPTSHPFISPSPYVLLLLFVGSTLCNKQRRLSLLCELWLRSVNIFVAESNGKESSSSQHGSTMCWKQVQDGVQKQ